MPSHPWFRFYSETLGDRKIRRIASELGLPRVIVIGAWAGLMSLANSSPVWGCLLDDDGTPLTVEEMGDDIGIDGETLQKLLAAFQKRSMIHDEDGVLHLSNWDKRQFQSDTSTERVQRYRERHAKAPEDAPPEAEQATETAGDCDAERSRNVTCNVSGTRQRTDTETDISGSPDDGSNEPSPPVPAARSPGRKRKVREYTPEERRQRAVLDALATRFSERTGLKRPVPRTDADHREARHRWWRPLEKIAEMAGWDVLAGRDLIDQTLERLEGLTVTDPNSLLKTAGAVAAENAAGTSGMAEAIARQRQRAMEDQYRFGVAVGGGGP